MVPEVGWVDRPEPIRSTQPQTFTPESSVAPLETSPWSRVDGLSEFNVTSQTDEQCHAAVTNTEQVMSAEVGGELKAVPTRRSLFGPDYVRLAILLLCGIAVHGWLISHTAIPARDSLGYARIAVKFGDPNGGETDPQKSHQRIEVIRDAEQPPGYPLAIWLTEMSLRVAPAFPSLIEACSPRRSQMPPPRCCLSFRCI